ncbi:MAG: hypothetical protein R3D89_09850 [Sphingomonadaceae bacterium]|jgi:hypothetical protein
MAKRSIKKKIEDAAPSVDELRGPSPNPYTNLLIADIVLRGGSFLVKRGIEKGLLGVKYAPGKAEKIIKGRTMGEALIGTAIARIATRSVPGAILVGGGMLAKTLYDRKKGLAAQAAGEDKLDAMADKGEDKDGVIHES